jgi:hypothetical protein
MKTFLSSALVGTLLVCNGSAWARHHHHHHHRHGDAIQVAESPPLPPTRCSTTRSETVPPYGALLICR